MIFKMTVNDNDYTSAIEHFCSNLIIHLFYEVKEDFNSEEEKFKYFCQKFDLQELMNPNNSKPLTDVEKQLICEFIKDAWNRWLDANEDLRSDKKEYLKKRFKIKIVYQYRDKRSNGEMVYYFYPQDKFITQ